MTQHDKHQYYFEKYLRNEMSQDERETFERKLADDDALRMAFEYYKLNRQKLLEQLIEEHQLTKKDNRLNKLIFLLISLTGIILVVAPFVNESRSQKQSRSDSTQSIFVRYIPFLNWENRTGAKSEPPPAPKKQTSEPVAFVVETIENLEPSLDREERLLSDNFIADSFVLVWEKPLLEKYKMLVRQDDSLAVDSIVRRQMAATGKPKKLLVEFWQSPLNYRGYLYWENKLVVYGLAFPNEILLYKLHDTVYWCLPDKQLPLIDEPKFSPF